MFRYEKLGVLCSPVTQTIQSRHTSTLPNALKAIRVNAGVSTGLEATLDISIRFKQFVFCLNQLIPYLKFLETGNEALLSGFDTVDPQLLSSLAGNLAAFTGQRFGYRRGMAV